MASIVKRMVGGRKGKRKTAVYHVVYQDAYGKPKWVKAGTDHTEAVKLGRRLEDERDRVRRGEVDPQADARRQERTRKADDHLADFKAHMEGKQRAANHVAYTIRDVRLLLEHSKVDHAGLVTVPHVDRWRNHCITVGYPDHRHPAGPPKPDSRKTANRRVASVKAWLKYCHNNGAIDRLVLDGYEMLETAGHETFKRRAMTKAEVVKLTTCAAVDEHRRAIYQFTLHSGFRRKEVASMTPASFDFVKGTITVLATDAKRKTENQTIPMHPVLVEPLKRLCLDKGPNDPVFDVPRQQVVVEVLRDDCVLAGVDPTHIDFHAQRHSFITLLADADARPDTLMGLARHKDLKTTMKYIHARDDDARNLIAKL